MKKRVRKGMEQLAEDAAVGLSERKRMAEGGREG